MGRVLAIGLVGNKRFAPWTAVFCPRMTAILEAEPMRPRLRGRFTDSQTNQPLGSSHLGSRADFIPPFSASSQRYNCGDSTVLLKRS